MKPLTTLLIKEFDADYYKQVGKELEDKGFTLIGSGSFRNTYKRGKVVVKVPRHWDGFDDNIGEAYAWRKYRNEPKAEDGIVFAPSRLLSNGCLMMVLVKPMSYDDLPDWGRYLDGSQAGEYNGRIVAYDAGCDLGLDKNEALVFHGLPETD